MYTFSMFHRNILAIGFGTLGLAIITLWLLLAWNGVDTEVTESDQAVITELGVGEECELSTGFESELECIQTVQETILEEFPDTTTEFERGVTGHTAADYVERGYGGCYDRATFIEQTLRFYGFDARRVGLWERQSNPLKYFKPGIPSHALSEVQTDAGWIVVGSIVPLVGVDSEKRPYDIADIRQGLLSGKIDDETFGTEIPNTFFDGEYVYGRGVYSRHGYFFEPHIPVPEINWDQFELPRF